MLVIKPLPADAVAASVCAVPAGINVPLAGFTTLMTGAVPDETVTVIGTDVDVVQIVGASAVSAYVPGAPASGTLYGNADAVPIAVPLARTERARLTVPPVAVAVAITSVTAGRIEPATLGAKFNIARDIPLRFQRSNCRPSIAIFLAQKGS